MRCAHRLPKRLVRLTSLSVCLGLVLTTVAAGSVSPEGSGSNPTSSNFPSNLVAWNRDDLIPALFIPPAFRSFDSGALKFLRYASPQSYQAISDSPFSLSPSSANNSAFNLPLPPLPQGNGYTYSRSITINHAQVPNTDQSNFPLLISGTYSYLKTVANGGYVQNSNGYDVIFTSDSGCATKLNHEVETYSATTGAVNYWVKVPTVSHTSDTMIYMCYRNASITTDQSNKTAVWDTNYKGVWHLPNGTSLNANDSTSNGVNGTVTSTAAATGQVDGGGSFDGSTSRIDMGNASALDGMTALTISAWIKPNSLTGANRIFTKWRGSFLVGTKLGAGDVLRLSVEKSGGGLSIFDSPASTLTTGSWQHLVLTWSQPNAATIYVNGTAKSVTITQDQNVTSTGTSSTAVQIGYSSDGLGNHFDGLIDEARMSNVVRSADWSKTEYNNQSSPSAFYTISAASGNQAPVANTGGPYTGTTGSSVSFNGSGSSDADGTIASYSWNFGDGGTGSGATPAHTYSVAGTYTVSLTVTDNAGVQTSASTTATIANRPPVANAGGPYTGTTGAAVQFSGTTSSDPDGTIASYSWNFGDSNSGSGATPTHTYATAGTYTVTLTVTDNLGATNSASTTATISNRPPVANAGGSYTGVTGTAVQFNGSSSSDPDGTIASYTWNFGDSNSGNGVTPTHTYATAGTYTVTLTVTDNLGSTASATASVTVTGTLDARLDPLNRTGTGSEDPLARNFSWSIPLVGLPGRGGLDLGLSLAYNSLATWTRNGNVVSFDDDRGSPSPGFRLGFPVIQGVYYNPQAGKNSFIIITPSGSRVELRQVGSSTRYQSVDSSYLLFDTNTLILRTTDGSQLSYAWMGSDYQCTEIKDRNGNFITISYDGLGRIDTVIDTLSRTIHFNYDTNGLSSITQTWAGQTHYWARFTYGSKTIQTNFTGLTVNGPQNGSTIHALTQVKLADDSHFDFDYTSWGQVWKISQYTGETNAHLLNYRSYNLPADNSTAQSNCPRFTVRHDWAENWNRDTNGTAQEVNTWFDAPIDTPLPDNSLQTVTMAKVKAPDNTYQQIYFAGSVTGGAGSAPAWKRGLPLLTDTFDSNNAKQRSVTTAWTQDDTNISYQLNPRVVETNITDPANNHARSRTEYAATTLSDGTTVNLPQDTYEYQANATTVLRRTHVDYKLTSDYTDRRIIGLPSAKYLCDGAQGEVPCNDASGASILSKMTFEYDESGSIQGNNAPVRHDNTYYTASFRVGRGNLSSVTRHDVVNTSQSTTSIIKYNTAGAVVATLDPLSHGVTVSYADSFSDNDNSRNTLAYPTMVTDAGGFSSSMKYNFDFGAPTWKQTPLPNVTDNEPGPVQTIAYDSFGRTAQVTNLVNNAYTRYVYGPNYVETFATVNTVADEAHSLQVFDGHGRVVGKASNHPGSTGGFSGQLFIYDNMGRVIRQSNPTETAVTISSGSIQPYTWTTAGDDAAAGWVYTQQSYDWKGRPLVTTNPSTTGNPADTTAKTASYGGCGCAGGEIVTLTDEVNRQQKIYSDVLGRTAKTEVLNWDSSVYSTTTNNYSARDQVTLVRQYQGADTSGVYQDTTMTYDGYGRLLTKHVPEQNGGTATTYAYNTDDTVNSVIDARGAAATYTYNNRHLVTGITYSAPDGITATSNVSFAYDAVGNRTSMTDGPGSMSYSYNQLSQMTSETRTFTGLASYALNYGYNLAGELTSITDPFGATQNYGFDATGRLNNITGSGYGSVTQFATNMQYHASGGLKSETYGSGITASATYNARLQVDSFQLRQANNFLAVSSSYQYYADGQLKFSHSIDERFDRAYAYDHAARATEAYSGSEARDFINHTNSGEPSGAYRQSYQYNALSQVSQQTNRLWSQTGGTVNTFVNNRRQGWSYDADGELAHDDTTSYTRDAANRIVAAAGGGSSSSIKFDGDGQMVWRQLHMPSNPPSTQTTYYLNSSLSGLAVAELNANGQKTVGHVYAGGRKIADAGVGYVAWSHTEPVTGSNGQSTVNGYYAPTAEFNADGVDVGFFDPTTVGGDIADPYSHKGGGLALSSGCGTGDCITCILDGFEHDCTQMAYLFDVGAAAPCPDNNCGPRYQPNRDGPSRGGWVLPVLQHGGFAYVSVGPSSKPRGLQPPKLQPVSPEEAARRRAIVVEFGSAGFGDEDEFILPQNTSRALSRSEILSLMDSILELFKNHHDCERSMDKLLGELKASTGYDAGSIRDVIEAFRQDGIAYQGDRAPLGPGDSGGGDAGTGMGGVPAISFSPGGTSEITAVLVMGEMMHWAGMPKQGGVYQNKFTDEVIANAASKLGFVMSIEQYRHTYPEQVAKDIARWNGRDMAESRVAHGAMDIKCLDIVTGMLPQSAKP